MIRLLQSYMLLSLWCLTLLAAAGCWLPRIHTMFTTKDGGEDDKHPAAQEHVAQDDAYDEHGYLFIFAQFLCSQGAMACDENGFPTICNIILNSGWCGGEDDRQPVAQQDTVVQQHGAQQHDVPDNICPINQNVRARKMETNARAQKLAEEAGLGTTRRRANRHKKGLTHSRQSRP